MIHFGLAIAGSMTNTGQFIAGFQQNLKTRKRLLRRYYKHLEHINEIFALWMKNKWN
jgi:hypothetical protein